MITLLRLHRVNGANLLHDLCRFRKVIGNLKPLGRCRDPFDRALNILTGFQIKGIDVAHPTSHVEKNNVGRRLRSFRGNFIAESLGSKAPP